MATRAQPLPRFEVRRNRVTRRYRFNLVAENGKVISSSQRYRSEDGVLTGIASVRENAPGAATVIIG